VPTQQEKLGLRSIKRPRLNDRDNSSRSGSRSRLFFLPATSREFVLPRHIVCGMWRISTSRPGGAIHNDLVEGEGSQARATVRSMINIALTDDLTELSGFRSHHRDGKSSPLVPLADLEPY
jgi:hypothetical protein